MAHAVYRDFNREYSDGTDGTFHVGVTYFIGSIEIEMNSERQLEVMVMGLQDNGMYLDKGGQAFLTVTVEPNMELYDAILAVLDQLTADHQYVLRGRPYLDVMLCSNEFAETHPGVCYPTDQPSSYTGGCALPFTRENMIYLETTEPNPDMESLDDTIRLLGEVRLPKDDEHPVFIYDTPIVSRDVDHRYYALTRNKTIWEVTDHDIYPDIRAIPDEPRCVCRTFYRETRSEPPQIWVHLHAPRQLHVTARAFTMPPAWITMDPDVDMCMALRTVLDHLTASCPDQLGHLTYQDHILCDYPFYLAHTDICMQLRLRENAGPWSPERFPGVPSGLVMEVRPDTVGYLDTLPAPETREHDHILLGHVSQDATGQVVWTFHAT